MANIFTVTDTRSRHRTILTGQGSVAPQQPQLRHTSSKNHRHASTAGMRPGELSPVLLEGGVGFLDMSVGLLTLVNEAVHYNWKHCGPFVEAEGKAKGLSAEEVKLMFTTEWHALRLSLVDELKEYCCRHIAHGGEPLCPRREKLLKKKLLIMQMFNTARYLRPETEWPMMYVLSQFFIIFCLIYFALLFPFPFYPYTLRKRTNPPNRRAKLLLTFTLENSFTSILSGCLIAERLIQNFYSLLWRTATF